MQMRTSCITALLAATLVAAIGPSADQARADNILVENDGSKWKLGSTVANPLIVPAKKGDVIEFKVAGPHGVVTLNKPGNQAPAPALDLVLACGEDPKTKPNHVLREVECGPGGSQFNKVLKAPMKLEVLDKLQGEVHFWCIIHKVGMWGTFKAGGVGQSR
jgi:hypothetical protein